MGDRLKGEPPRALTPRHLDICRLLAHGHCPAEIAEMFGSSQNTVHNQARELYRRLNVHSALEAAARYWRWQVDAVYARGRADTLADRYDARKDADVTIAAMRGNGLEEPHGPW